MQLHWRTTSSSEEEEGEQRSVQYGSDQNTEKPVCVCDIVTFDLLTVKANASVILSEILHNTHFPLMKSQTYTHNHCSESTNTTQ